MNTIKLKKGDAIKVIAGKDKGKTGKIVRVYPLKNRIAVEGINVYKKHVRPRTANEKGQIVEVARSIHASNVAIVCGACGKTTRIGMQQEGDSKRRVCKQCKAAL